MHVFAKPLSIAVLAAAMAAVTADHAQADFICDAPNTRFAPINTVQTTSSTSFTDVPGAVVDFAVDAGTCAVVEFSGQVRARDPGAMRIRVNLDQAGEQIDPPSAQVFTSANKFDERAVTFIVQNVAAGARTARLQFLSVDGNPVSINRATIVVHYQPAD